MKALFIVLLALSCTSEPLAEARISSEFTADQAEYIIEGVDLWCKSAAKRCVKVAIVPPEEANIVPGATKTEVAYGQFFYGKVTLNLSNIHTLEKLKFTAAHEFGHALNPNSGHAHLRGHLMSVYSTDKAPDEEDVAWMSGDFPEEQSFLY